MKSIYMVFFLIVFSVKSLAFSFSPNSHKPGGDLAGDSLGEQKLAVILVDLMANETMVASPDKVRQAIFDEPASPAQFIKESSYGKASLVGDVFGWYQINKPDECSLSHEELFEFLSDKMNLSDYERYIVLYDTKEVGCGLGHSSFGRNTYQTPQGNIRVSLSVAQIRNRFVNPQIPFQSLSHLTSSVINHELGHALGIRGHANLLECGDKSFSTVSGECSQAAIADMFNAMAGEGFNRASLHNSACHKEELGWITSNQKVELNSEDINSSQVYRISIFEKDLGGNLTLRINLKNPIPISRGIFLDRLYIEYRTATGFDSRINQLSQDPKSMYRNMNILSGAQTIDSRGVQLRAAFINNRKCVTTYLIDPHPGSIQYLDEDYSLYDALDGFLLKGESLLEPNNGLKIKVENLTDQWADIRIEKLQRQ